MKEIALPYEPRKAFVDFHNRKQRWACLVCHRRAGKSYALVNDLVIGVLEEQRRRPQFAFIAPTYAQAKRIAWEYLKDAARPILKGTPNETELRVDTINDGRIFLAGSDNADSLRGVYLDGAVIDEFAQQNPMVWTQIIRPALADRNGWAVLAGTPNGRNHFHDTHLAAMESPDWFHMRLPASTSGILDASELLALRATMSDEEYEQELECSFEATSKGRILASYVEKARAEGRISDDVLFDPQGAPIEVSSDLGFRDTSVWWFWQPTMTGFNVFDCLHGSGLDAAEWANELRKTGYRIRTIWLPHDGAMKGAAQGNVTVKVQLEAAGYSTLMVPKTSVKDRIEAARVVARLTRFNATKCKDGLRQLGEWTFGWNIDTKSFSNDPKHDGASHFGDAFSYGAIALHHATPATRITNPIALAAFDHIEIPRVIPSVGGSNKIASLRDFRAAHAGRIIRGMRGG